jgi:hypothetical protein
LAGKLHCDAEEIPAGVFSGADIESIVEEQNLADGAGGGIFRAHPDRSEGGRALKMGEEELRTCFPELSAAI